MLYLFNQQNEHQKALIFLTLHLLPWVCVISQRSNQQLAQRTERLAADCRESLRDKTSEGALSVTTEVVIGTAMMLSLGTHLCVSEDVTFICSSCGCRCHGMISTQAFCLF